MEIRIPRLGWSMEEGVFAGWLKKAGEAVRSGEPLFTLEGEKATQDIESIGEGVLHLAPDAPVAGQVVLVGRLIGLLCPAGEEPAWAGLSSAPVPAPANPIQANPTRTVAASVNSILAATPATLAATAASVAASPSVRRLARQMGIDLNRVVPAWPGGRVGDHDLRPATIAGAPPTGRLLATPRARRLARLQGVDLAGLSGTGAKGRIRERDVPVVGPAKAAELPANAQAISSTRRTIARHMLKSRQETVPVTLTTRADATALLALRANLKHGHGVDAPTFNDMILKILADLLLAHPQMGARWEETHLVLPGEKIDVGLAVESPAGLVVPVVRDVQRLSLAEVARQSRELVERARLGKLGAGEMRGGLFTLTSLGAYGVEYFNPVIHWPQCAILGLGMIRPQPVPLPSGQEGFTFRKELPLSLTFDHRVVDGAPAARFLRDLVEQIEVIGV